MSTIPSPNTSAQTSASHDWLDRHGAYLFGYATLRLRSHEAAERVVVETLMAAEGSGRRFDEPSAERKWLQGILKETIIDHYRKNSSDKGPGHQIASCSQHDPFQGPDGWLGHWVPELAPRNWEIDGSATLEREDFWRGFSRCVAHLPEIAAMAYTLREVDGLSLDEICNVLSMSSDDLAALLHHARLELRIFVEAEMLRGEPANPKAPLTKPMDLSDDQIKLSELKDAFKFAALVRPRNLLNVQPLQS